MTQIEIRVSMDELQSLSLKLAVGLFPASLLLFSYLWGFSDSLAFLGNIHDSLFVWTLKLVQVVSLFVVSLFIGTALHEGIHALFFAPFLKSGFRGLKFGYMAEKMAPYVHLLEPISITGFRIGAAAPGLLVGLLPLIAGLWFGVLSLLLFGLIFTLGAVGDLMLLIKTAHLDTDYTIRDMSDDIGLFAFKDSPERS